ncbi:nucleoside deaminase [Acetobacteraceae bacterium KSS8]|uniref:Nucleoside deaminase n=1 Tax=Endosaccharibacter trunci TaxID=2812733 RepID=A0ABT1W8P6_9PROT|nr:nucleoside deaminase [Acetobacteraceae bacterium KSS8]
MPPTDDDAFWMQRALTLARNGKNSRGGGPIGCVILLDGKVVGEAHNEVSADHDPTAHAETTAIRRACAALGRDDLRGATLYSTLQPCGMCSMASIWTSIGRVVYGAGRPDVHRMYFECRSLNLDDILADAYRDDIRFTVGVLREECAALYYGPGDAPPLEEQANI